MPQVNKRPQSLSPLVAAFACLAAIGVAGVVWAQAEGDPKERPAKPPAASEPRPMNNELLGRLLVKHFPNNEVVGGDGVWRISLAGAQADNGVQPADAPNEDAPAVELNGKPPEQADPDEENDGRDDDGEEPEGPGAGGRLPAVMIVLTDERANRMRLMMPVRPFDPNNVDDLRLALIALHANYDRALDARYAIQDGVLWSVFIHPLGSLTPDDLKNAINQVRELRRTTGTTFSSSGLMFGGEQRQGEDEEPPLEPDNPNDDVI